MKRKRVIGIAAVMIGIIVIFLIQNYNNKFPNTLDKREDFISQHELGAVINSETKVEEHIVSEIIAGNKWGYAIFEPDGKDKYRWQSTSLTQSQLYSETILINGSSYEVLIGRKPHLDYVKTIYTDMDSGKTSSVITELNGKIFAVQKSPDFKSYTRKVTWYDTAGRQYTE